MIDVFIFLLTFTSKAYDVRIKFNVELTDKSTDQF